MVFRKPYGFLIKHFKLIHLILTALYIYLTIKVNSILGYYNRFIAGTASKLDAESYITSYYSIVAFIAIVICIIIYALMRYKKKPRTLYLILIGFSIVVAWMIQYSYEGLHTIYISVLDSKSQLLYRDLLRILIIFQYISIAVVLVRGLGFDIKKFNFVQDLEELDIDVSDDEEVELTLGSTETLGRKFHRNWRELKYYYLENKAFLLIIMGIFIMGSLGYLLVDKEVINKEYQQQENFSTVDFRFQVLATYITNKGFDNQEIKNDSTSFVIVKMNVGTNSEKKELNTSNLILEVNNNHYVSEKKYAARFTDLGVSYRGEKISGFTPYLFIFNVANDDLEKKMRIVYAQEKTVHLNPVFLDKEAETKKYTLGKNIDLSTSSLGSGSLKISSFEIKDKFSYPYQYEIGGEVYTNQLTISSVQNIIMYLEISSSYPYGLDNYSFLEKYAKLKYKKDDKEYVSEAFDDKTPGDYKKGLYLSVDKEILDAKNVWLEIKVRNIIYQYTLK